MLARLTDQREDGHRMNTWTEALDQLKGIPEKNIASTDQKLLRAQVLALLAIGQELSRIGTSGATGTSAEA
jgi:hypothetical protein